MAGGPEERQDCEVMEEQKVSDEAAVGLAVAIHCVTFVQFAKGADTADVTPAR